MPAPDATWDGERWYAVHVSNSGRVSLRWSAPLASAALARAEAKRRVDDGEGTLAFAVHANGRVRRLIGIYPRSAERVIDHYRALMSALGT